MAATTTWNAQSILSALFGGAGGAGAAAGTGIPATGLHDQTLASRAPAGTAAGTNAPAGSGAGATYDSIMSSIFGPNYQQLLTNGSTTGTRLTYGNSGGGGSSAGAAPGRQDAPATPDTAYAKYLLSRAGADSGAIDAMRAGQDAMNRANIMAWQNRSPFGLGNNLNSYNNMMGQANGWIGLASQIQLPTSPVQAPQTPWYGYQQSYGQAPINNVPLSYVKAMNPAAQQQSGWGMGQNNTGVAMPPY